MRLTSHAGKSRSQSCVARRASAALVAGPEGAAGTGRLTAGRGGVDGPAAIGGAGGGAGDRVTGGGLARRGGAGGVGRRCTGAVAGRAGGGTGLAGGLCRTSRSFRAARSCSSESSMLVPHIQQSATISHSRIDIGPRHSGHAHDSTSPLSHRPAAAASAWAAKSSGGGAASPVAGSEICKLESCSAVLMTRREAKPRTDPSPCSLTPADIGGQQAEGSSEPRGRVSPRLAVRLGETQPRVAPTG
jgi:hypothetical protein